MQKEYNDDGLSGYTVSSLKAVCHRYIFFFIYGELGFFPPAVRAHYILGLLGLESIVKQWVWMIRRRLRVWTHKAPYTSQIYRQASPSDHLMIDLVQINRRCCVHKLVRSNVRLSRPWCCPISPGIPEPRSCQVDIITLALTVVTIKHPPCREN